MSWPQHWTVPSPALVQSTCVPQLGHVIRFPNWFANVPPSAPYSRGRFDHFRCIGWPQQFNSPVPALVTIISEPHLVHM